MTAIPLTQQNASGNDETETKDEVEYYSGINNRRQIIESQHYEERYGEEEQPGGFNPGTNGALRHLLDESDNNEAKGAKGEVEYNIGDGLW